MNYDQETEIAGLLAELADVQSAQLAVLSEKRALLAAADHAALAAVAGRERTLVSRLQACHERRQELLTRSQAEGLPSDSVRALSSTLPPEARDRDQASVEESQEWSRLLQNQSLTNWVLVQRSLLHLSQLIEIIAIGGRPLPRYGNDLDRHNCGSLVDRAS